MPNPIYRFDNTPWGGVHNFTVSEQDMPDWFPFDQIKDQDVLRAKSGQAWSYIWYQKESAAIAFRHIGSNTLATLGSIARAGIAFRWYKDTSTSGSGTGTFIFTGPFSYSPLTPDYTDLDFTVEEL